MWGKRNGDALREIPQNRKTGEVHKTSLPTVWGKSWKCDLRIFAGPTMPHEVTVALRANKQKVAFEKTAGGSGNDGDGR